MARKRQVSGWIRFSFVDHRGNCFVELGGAGWPGTRIVRARWQALPVLDETRTSFLADRLGADGCTILDTKFTTAEAIEERLGEQIAILIERGRRELGERRQAYRARLGRVASPIVVAP